MKTYPIKKRYGEETLDVREFIRPQTLPVLEFTRKRTQFETKKLIIESWNWINTNIKYPHYSKDTEQLLDLHVMNAFLDETSNSDTLVPKIQQSTIDFWNFPSETLNEKVGDCDDTSNLLCSILRTRLNVDEVFVSVGYFANFGHTWVTIFDKNNEPLVLETTTDKRVESKDITIEDLPYDPVFRFNDKNVIELKKTNDFITRFNSKQNIFEKNIELQRFYGIK